jgi:hypothetical protein
MNNREKSIEVGESFRTSPSGGKKQSYLRPEIEIVYVELENPIAAASVVSNDSPYVEDWNPGDTQEGDISF